MKQQHRIQQTNSEFSPTSLEMKSLLISLQKGALRVGRLAIAIGFMPIGLGTVGTAVFEASSTPPVLAAPISCNGIPGITQLYFSGRTRISGTNDTVGAKYRYTNVTGDNTTDAIVTILTTQIPTGATLTSADNDTAPATGSNGFLPRHLTPSFTFNNTANQTVSISYRIEFVQAGTTTPTKLSVIPIAIDNDGDGGTLRESSEFSAPNGGYLLNQPTSLTQSGNRFTSPQTQVVGFSTDPNYAVGAIYFDTSSFDWTWSFNTGANGSSQAPRYGALEGACPITFNPAPTFKVDTVKSAGTPTMSGANTYDIPFTVKVGNLHSRNLPNVQVSENLTRTFSTGSPTITISSAPTVTGVSGGTCTVNSSFNGISNFNLLSGSDLLQPNQSCTITFTARVAYPTAASIPSTAQNNSVYASSTSTGPNPGYTFPSGGTPTPPANILKSNTSTDASDTSTNGTNLPSAANGDTASPTPVTLPLVPDLTISKSHTGNFTIGGTGTYTITVTNGGRASTSGTITVTDTLPTGLTVNGGAAGSVTKGGTNASNWTCNSNAASPQVITCTSNTAISSTAGSNTSVFTLTTNVGTSTPTGTNSITNQVRVAGGGETVNTNNTFNDPTNVIAQPTVDLDGNDSSGVTGNNYQNTFVIGGGAIRATDTDVTITDEKNFINSATITLTNRPDTTNESLSIDATAGGTGVTASTYNATIGVITLTSTTSGTITLAQYQAIIATLKYNNTVASPNTTNRTINVQVTDSDGLASNTAVSTISFRQRASLLLVKRITAINSIAITNVVDDPNDANDTNANWPSSYLKGATSPTNIKPGDVVEYTIYFLSNGGSDASNASFCDLVPANTTFASDAFATGRGIQQASGTATPVSLTNNATDSDAGRFYSSTETLPASCKLGSITNGNGTTTLSNVGGAVVVNIGTVPRATTAGTPANSYGFIRFRVQVQ